jgi:Spy/CpxP family protein refolding chaperone
MKKTMILLLPILLAISSIAQPGSGQSKGKRGQGPQEKGAGMKSLNLTAEQQKQMKDLQTNFREQLKALHENENMTVKEQRDRRDKMMKQHRSDVEKLLTPEQRKQMADRKASRERMAKLKSDMQLEKIGTKLNLSADQVATLRANREKNMAQMKAIRDNENLDRSARQKQMQSLKKQHDESLAKVLNKEQLAQFKDLQQKGMKEMRQKGQGRNQEMRRGGGRGDGQGEGRGMRGQPAK